MVGWQPHAYGWHTTIEATGIHISVEQNENERQLVNAEWTRNYSAQMYNHNNELLVARTAHTHTRGMRFNRIDFAKQQKRLSVAFFSVIDHA